MHQNAAGRFFPTASRLNRVSGKWKIYKPLNRHYRRGMPFLASYMQFVLVMIWLVASLVCGSLLRCREEDAHAREVWASSFVASAAYSDGGLILCLIGAADCLGHVRIVTGCCSGLLDDVLLELLQLRKRVVPAKIQLPGIGRLFGNDIHANGFIRPGGRVALANNGKTVIAWDEAGGRSACPLNSSRSFDRPPLCCRNGQPGRRPGEPGQTPSHAHAHARTG